MQQEQFHDRLFNNPHLITEPHSVHRHAQPFTPHRNIHTAVYEYDGSIYVRPLHELHTDALLKRPIGNNLYLSGRTRQPRVASDVLTSRRRRDGNI